MLALIYLLLSIFRFFDLISYPFVLYASWLVEVIVSAAWRWIYALVCKYILKPQLVDQLPVRYVPPRPMRVSYVAVPVFIESGIDAAVCKQIEIFTFYAGGAVQIGNATFYPYTAIDHAFPGGHAYRLDWSNVLKVRMNSSPPEEYIFAYTRVSYWRFVWVRLIRNCS